MAPFIDYEILRLAWWLLIGVLLIGFAMLDGFDMGAAILLPWVARSDVERRVVINSIAPIWEGNQVWFILGGGAIFAAWPIVYATAFSGFYIAMFVLLVALILRPVGFDFRNKVEDPRWRGLWDMALFLGGFVPALVFGVVFGNLLQGVPFRLDDTLRVTYTGSFIGLFNPFAILCGVTSVALLTMHGGVYLQLKTEAKIAARARQTTVVAALVMVTLFSLGGFWVDDMRGYVVTGALAHDGPSNPLVKTVARGAGAWLDNFGRHPWMLAAPAMGYLGAAGVLLFTALHRPGLGFIASAAGVFGVVATPGLAMFPFMLPSSSHPASSLTVWDSSSSQLTLQIMLFACIIFLPLIGAYTSWVYRIVRGKVTERYVRDNTHSLY